MTATDLEEQEVGGADKRGRGALGRLKLRTALLFLLPTAVLLAVVAGWPLLRTIALSFTDSSLYALDEPSWIRFDNYLYFLDGQALGILADPLWWASVRNTLVFAVASVAIEFALGMGIALTLNKAFRFRGVVRTLILIPWAIPTIITAQVWIWMLHDQYGIVNRLLEAAGLIAEGVPWLTQESTALASIILIDVWKTTPFMTLMLLAALQTVPKDLIEAARIDGASAVQTFFHVTLPVIFPAAAVAVVFRLLDALRVFGLIYVVSPADEDIMSMSVYVRRMLFEFGEFGQGSAASMLLFAVVFMLAVFWIRISRATERA